MIHASVIGAGPMGTSIAGELAHQGIKVQLFDVIPFKADECIRELTSKLPELRQCGLVSSGCNFAAMIKPCRSLKEAVINAEIVFEAVVENAAIKKRVFEDVATHCPSHCVIGSNSLTLDIGQLSQHIPHPERVIGIRFLHPVFGVQGVEITPTHRTSDEARVIVESFLAQSLRKTPFYRATAAPRFVMSKPTYTTTSLVRASSDPVPSSLSQRMQLGPSSHAGPAPSHDEPFRLPFHAHQGQQFQDGPLARGGPGGPGAVGTGRVPQHYPNMGPGVDSSSTIGHGGSGSIGYPQVHTAGYPVAQPTMQQGPGGPGGLGTGTLPPAIQGTSGPMPEGPGGPGASGTGAAAVRVDQPHEPMSADGPGGPGAWGTRPLPSTSPPADLSPTAFGAGGPGALGTAQAVPGQANSGGNDEQQSSCVVCMDAARNVLLCPCHHFCVCTVCAESIRGRRGECPVCRTTIDSIIPVYVS